MPSRTYFTDITKNETRWHRLCLIVLLFAALVLRFYGIDVQSLWLDELYTMREADPSVSWHDTVSMVLVNEGQSPLFFFLEKIMLTLFGYTGVVARTLPALAGVAGVYAIYCLGRELHTSRTGLIAALLTAINHFTIYYSQEARVYSILFLFTVLSFLFLVRLLRSQTLKNALWYGVTALFLLYLHYYSLFVVFAQVLIVLFSFFKERENRVSYLKYFSISGLIAGLGYMPLLSYLMRISRIRSSWIQSIPEDFLQTYFYVYFGSSDLLMPLLYCLLIFYLLVLISIPEQENKALEKKTFSFTVLLTAVWLGSVYLIPYLRSVLVVPMLVDRYTIIGLPAFILMLSTGANHIKNHAIRRTFLALFTVVSLANLFFIKSYYSKIYKDQFREMTKFIGTSKKESYPIINSVTVFEQYYYLQQFGIKRDLISEDKETFVKNVLNDHIAGKELSGFWLAGAHRDPKLSKGLSAGLDSLFVLEKEADLVDAWAQLYVPRKKTEHIVLNVRATRFSPSCWRFESGDTLIAMWNGTSLPSDSVFLEAGNYTLRIRAKSSACNSEYATISLHADEKLLGMYNTSAYMELSQDFKLNVIHARKIKLSLRLENDKMNRTEDINAFVKEIYILRN